MYMAPNLGATYSTNKKGQACIAIGGFDASSALNVGVSPMIRKMYPDCSVGPIPHTDLLF